MTFTDTSTGNIAFVDRGARKDVAHVGPFEEAFRRVSREPMPFAGVEALRLSLILYAARFTRSMPA